MQILPSLFRHWMISSFVALGTSVLLLAVAGCSDAVPSTTVAAQQPVQEPAAAEPAPASEVESAAPAAVETTSSPAPTESAPPADVAASSAPAGAIDDASPSPKTEPVEVALADVAATAASESAAKEVAQQPKQQDSAPKRDKSRVQDITFDNLKFEMEKDGPYDRSMLTEEIEDLNGARIRIGGFILPASVFSQTGFSRFIFVRDNQECCFGPGAALYDAIVVEMEPGKTADYNVLPVTVEGVFTIKEMKGPGGRPLAIYHLLASSVK